MNNNRPFSDVLQRWALQYESIRKRSPKYLYLANMIVEEIIDGVFANGEKLPPHRLVADALNISIQTVSSAYRDVEHQGYIHCEVGRGSYVFKQITEETRNYIRDIRDTNVMDLSVIRPVYTKQHDEINRQIMLKMADSGHFDWMRACRPVAGFYRHRETLSQWIQPRLSQVKPQNMIITNGCSQAIFLALASFIHTNDVVLTENLTDHGIIGCSKILRFILKGLHCDEQGIIPASFEKACQLDSVKALVCTPSHTNPTFTVMGTERRKAIAGIAQKYGVMIIEDDVSGLLTEQQLPLISDLLPDQSFYTTSFSKSTLTGARVGFLVAPANFTLRAESVLKVTSWMATPLIAEMVTKWIEEGTLETLVDIQKSLIAERQAVIAEHLGRYIPNHQRNALGCWLQLPDNIKPAEFADRLLEKQIAVSTAYPFIVSADAGLNAVRICLGGDLSLELFSKAVTTIKQVIEQQAAV